MNKKYLALIYLIIAVNLNLVSQDYYSAEDIKYDDHVYDVNIGTVQLYPEGNAIGYPFIKLESGNKLILEFDDLASRGLNFGYTLILCNDDWSPADLSKIEYIEGYQDAFFSESSLSYNTTRKYSHYQVSLPADNMKIAKSGNYLLKVYEEGNDEQALITRRLYVFEENVDIDATAGKGISPENYYDKHELSISLNLIKNPVGNVYEDLKVYVQQNGRKDNIKMLTSPTSVNNELVKYNRPGEIVFEATNEFRKLDTRSLKIQSANSFNTVFTKDGFEVSLIPESFRSRYLYYADIQGQFSVINRDDTHLNHNIESDYVKVNFNFSAIEPFDSGGVYLIGSFTNWRPTSSSRLIYNQANKMYETTLYIKQGYYEYHYVYFGVSQKAGTTMHTENNFSDTRNNYTIYVYYKGNGDYHQRLLGIKTIVNN